MNVLSALQPLALLLWGTLALLALFAALGCHLTTGAEFIEGFKYLAGLVLAGKATDAIANTVTAAKLAAIRQGVK
jgi:hypothetical protein